ncbi:hypothetical protein HABEBGDM_00201 [Mycoplasmopsis arginini]|nr:hypothetical protein [Mycoplasmopsis arginini]
MKLLSPIILDEIRISAQEFSSKESGMYEYYKISESILINFDQHLFFTLLNNHGQNNFS